MKKGIPSLSPVSEEAQVAETLLGVINEYERAHEAWLASVPPHVDLPANAEYEAFDAALERLFAFPCYSYADVLTKANYFYCRRTEAAKTAYCSYEGGEYNAEFLASIQNSIALNDAPTSEAREQFTRRAS